MENITFIEGQKGKNIIYYKGFIYHKKKTYKNGTIVWECQQRKSGCGVQITTLNNELKTGPNINHFHPDDKTFCEDSQYRKHLKETAASRPEANPTALINELEIVDGTVI